MSHNLTGSSVYVTLRDMATKASNGTDDPGLTPPIEPTSFHRQLLLQNVRPSFLRGFIKALLWAYRRSDEICRDNFDEPEAHDSVGDIRRGLIEGVLRSQAVRHGGQSKTPRNRPGTAYYTRVDFGRLRLTQCAVDSPGRIRRPADFRGEMAAESQLFFPAVRGRRADADVATARSYAVIYHGHFLESRKLPGFNIREPDFLGISFPNEDCTGSIAMIDLTAQLRYEIDSAKLADVEQAGDLNLGFSAKTGARIDDEEENG